LNVRPLLATSACLIRLNNSWKSRPFLTQLY